MGINLVDKVSRIQHNISGWQMQRRRSDSERTERSPLASSASRTDLQCGPSRSIAATALSALDKARCLFYDLFRL